MSACSALASVCSGSSPRARSVTTIAFVSLPRVRYRSASDRCPSISRRLRASASAAACAASASRRRSARDCASRSRSGATSSAGAASASALASAPSASSNSPRSRCRTTSALSPSPGCAPVAQPPLPSGEADAGLRAAPSLRHVPGQARALRSRARWHRRAMSPAFARAISVPMRCRSSRMRRSASASRVRSVVGAPRFLGCSRSFQLVLLLDSVFRGRAPRASRGCHRPRRHSG